MLQRVKPVEGYYIATYACPVGELGDQFVGYFKVFGKQPRCYCDQDYLFAGNQPVSFAAAADALADGERGAGAALLRLQAGDASGRAEPGAFSFSCVPAHGCQATGHT